MKTLKRRTPYNISYNARPPDTDSGQEFNPRLFLGPGYSGLFLADPALLGDRACYRDHGFRDRTGDLRAGGGVVMGLLQFPAATKPQNHEHTLLRLQARIVTARQLIAAEDLHNRAHVERCRSELHTIAGEISYILIDTIAPLTKDQRNDLRELQGIVLDRIGVANARLNEAREHSDSRRDSQTQLILAHHELCMSHARLGQLMRGLAQ